MTVSPFDHPLLSALLGDDETARAFSVEADVAAMVEFERALAEAEAAEGIIEPAAADAILVALTSFTPDVPKLKEGVARDGMIGPELVRQMRSAVVEKWRKDFHFGSTSQDVIDTSLVLRLKPVVERYGQQLGDLIDRFAELEFSIWQQAADGCHPNAAGNSNRSFRPHFRMAAAA